MANRLDDPAHAWAVMWGLIGKVAVIFDSALWVLEHKRNRRLTVSERLQLGVHVIEILEDKYSPKRKR